MINFLFKTDAEQFDYAKNLMPINQNYTFQGSNIAFGQVSKINIFIGENNSGKSRFLRHLYRTFFYGFSTERFREFYQFVKRSLRLSPYYKMKYDINDFNRIYDNIGREKTAYTNVPNKFFSGLFTVAKKIDARDKFYIPVLRGVKDYRSIINNKLRNFATSAHSIQNKDPINHYISLLNIEPSGLENFDVYREIIVREYFKDAKESIDNILTGGKLYQEIKSMLLGDETQRKLINEFQVFLKENFFFEYDSVQLIPRETEKVLYVRIGNVEKAIYDWGDGTQQLIVILFSLFKYKDSENKMFFIEEPEMYLHPGILRKFIEVISSDIFKNHQYFITTHSNNILDISADVDIDMSIFKFKKLKDLSSKENQRFIIEQCNSGDVSLLNELGVRNSSVFMSNCSIWVEGITDRLYLKHYLELYIKKNGKVKYRENIDYTFIEYSGVNLAHFNFDDKDSANDINAKYINNKIFLIADNDGTSQNSAKGKRKEHLKEVLKDNFYELNAREIENLITCEVLKNILIEQNPDKNEIITERFARKKSISKDKIGNFIDNVLNESGKHSAKSGTVKNKLNFCKAVIEKINDFDMLSDEAKHLIERIYNFIESNNR